MWTTPISYLSTHIPAILPVLSKLQENRGSDASTANEELPSVETEVVKDK